MATITAQPTITPPADASLPRFTPAPDCLTDLYRTTTECGSDKTPCTYFHVGKRWSYDACLPNQRHPATACPVSYTDVEFDTSVEGGGKTAVTLHCCPQGYGFARQDTTPTSTLVSSKEFRFESLSCLATKPTLPGRDSPPWTVPATEVYTSYLGTTAIRAGENKILATINPTSDLLVASAVAVTYQVSAGTTCAPGCDNPWRSGDPWPLPSPTEPEIHGGENSVTLGFTYIFGIVIGCVVFGPLIVWGLSFWFKRFLGRPKTTNMGAEQQKIPLERYA